MKKNVALWILSVSASLFLSTGLLAQEQIEMSIKVKKDGKLVKDTTYLFDDAAEAKNAIKMMEVISGEGLHEEHITYNYTSEHSGHGETKAMVFISEDGETTEITEFSGDSNVWVTEEEADGKKVIVMKSEGGNTFDILVDEDSEGGDVVKTKKVKVIVSDDEDGTWTAVEGDEKMIDEDIYIIEGDDNVKVEVKKIMKEHDGEENSNVKVIVIKKSGEKDHDEDCDQDHDEDSDQDLDSDHEEEIEVKVIKKK